MKKILIVEDDTDISFIYTRALKNAGYSVDQAEDGVLGLDKAQKNLYDLILLDIMLPKASGIDVLKEIRKPGSKAKSTPVYLLTNLAQDTIIQECFKIGAQGYMVKAQLSPDDVVLEIDTFFHKHPTQGV